MLRALLISALLLSGCWTFRALDEPADASPDVRTSDGGFDVDMRVRPDRATMPSTLTVRVETCTAPTTHPALAPGDRPTGGSSLSFARDIGFVQTAIAPFTAELAWVQGGEATHSTVDLTSSLISREQRTQFPTVAEREIRSVTLGPTDDGVGYTWAATAPQASCSSDYWWGGRNEILENSIGCASGIELYALGVSGGFNRFTGDLRGPALRVVWQADEPEGDLVVAAPVSFESDEASSAAWSDVTPDVYTLPTTGTLTFLGTDNKELYAWDHSQPAGQGAAPPRATGLQTRRGEVAAIALSIGAYVIAHVEGTSIVIERFGVQPGTAAEVRSDGIWTQLEGLSSPHALALAAFQGGFALWYAEREMGAAGEASQWTVVPFKVEGAELVHYDCAYSYSHGLITYVDNKLIANRDGSDLFVVGAVHYLQNTPSINVEGPFWPGLLDQ